MATAFHIEEQTGRLRVERAAVTSTTGTFDPLRSVYVAQNRRPSHIIAVDPRSLTALERGCLMIDGTITCYLESQLLEPIEVITCAQGPEYLAADDAWLDAVRGDRIIRRHVRLRGADSGRVHVLATSLLVEDRLRAAIGHDFGTIPEGIGRMLVDARIEQRRELLWYGRAPVPGVASEHLTVDSPVALTRTYRIFARGRPLMLITEWFDAIAIP